MRPTRMRYLLLYPAVVLGIGAAGLLLAPAPGLAFFGHVPVLACIGFGTATLPLARSLRRGSDRGVAAFALAAAVLTVLAVVLLIRFPVGVPRPFSATVYLVAVVPLAVPMLATWAAYPLSARASARRPDA